MLAEACGDVARGTAEKTLRVDGDWPTLHPPDTKGEFLEPAALIETKATACSRDREVSVPLSDGATIAGLYRHGEVRSRRDDGEMALLTVALDAAASAQFERRLAR